MGRGPEKTPGGQPGLFDKQHIERIADHAAIRVLVEGVKKDKEKKKQDRSFEKR